jgi:hypothetical protein
LQLFAFGIGVGFAGDGDSDVYGSDECADCNDGDHDFGDDLRRSRFEDTNGEPYRDGPSPGLHADHQQLSVIRSVESGGYFKWSAAGTQRLQQRCEPELRRRGTADVHDCARFGDAHSGRDAIHGHPDERSGAGL